MTEAVKEIFMEGAKKYGWLDNEFEQIKMQERREIAKEMLVRGYPIEEVAEIMKLPIETVMDLR